MLSIALAETLWSADSWASYAEFGRVKEPLLRQSVGLEHGFYSQDTSAASCAISPPRAPETALGRFVAEIGRALGPPAEPAAWRVAAIDGKRLRGAL